MESKPTSVYHQKESDTDADNKRVVGNGEKQDRRGDTGVRQ